MRACAGDFEEPWRRIDTDDLGAKGGKAPAPDRVRYAHSGDFCVIIPIKGSDIWAFYEKYKSKYVFMSEGPVVLMANPDPKAVQGMGEMSFRDPDGLYVNIVSVNCGESLVTVSVIRNPTAKIGL